MRKSKNYNPATALTIMLRLDALALEVFKRDLDNSFNSKKRGYIKKRMVNRGFSLDELASIHPFKRSNENGKTNSKRVR